MQSADIRLLFKLLGKGRVRFVGGCVRNALLGLPVGDIDLATTHLPQQVSSILSKKGIKVVPTGIDHGTVTAVLNGVGYEITTLRRDVETDGRRAVVAYTENWAEDAARRDFTFNALYADLDGTIYDPLGRGVSDLDKRKVVFVGNAAERIQEDYLRILRYFRFHSLYGKGGMNKKALEACCLYAKKISTLSRERVTQEFSKILMGDSPQNVLAVMSEAGILPQILGKDFNPERFGILIKLQKALPEGWGDTIFCARLILAVGGRGQRLKTLSNSLILNKKQIALLADSLKIKINTKRNIIQELQKNLYLHGRFSTAVALMVMAEREGLSVRSFEKIWRIFSAMDIPQFPLSGKDLMALGVPAGVGLGEELARLEIRWIKSGFSASKNDLLAKVENYSS